MRLRAPQRRHRNEDEIVYVLDGAIRVYLYGEPCRVPAGSCLRLRRGSEDCSRVESGEADLLTVVMPAGSEGYYVELGGPKAAADIKQPVTVAARYGVEITAPPPGVDMGASE